MDFGRNLASGGSVDAPEIWTHSKDVDAYSGPEKLLFEPGRRATGLTLYPFVEILAGVNWPQNGNGLKTNIPLWKKFGLICGNPNGLRMILNP